MKYGFMSLLISPGDLSAIKAGIVLTRVEVRNTFNLKANGFVAQSRDRGWMGSAVTQTVNPSNL